MVVVPRQTALGAAEEHFEQDFERLSSAWCVSDCCSMTRHSFRIAQKGVLGKRWPVRL